MPSKLKEWGKKILFAFNIIIVILYLLVCLVPFADPGKFWFISVLGLGFPGLFFVMLLLLAFWTVKKSKWALLHLVALLISWQQVSAAFGIHFFKKEFNIEKEENTLRVLSWNINRWDEGNKERKGGVSFRQLMLDFIQTQDADVLCFQEFFESHLPVYFAANIPPLEKMGYIYHCFLNTSNEVDGNYQNGMIILSRFPIIDSMKTTLGSAEHPEGLCYADIKVQNNIFRIATTHLQSIRLTQEEYEGLGKMKQLGAVFNKIKNSFGLRAKKANLVNDIIRASPYPVVICANLDDVPNSYAYFTVKGNLQDAFLKKGAGLGRTFQFVLPTLRIDYIFADRRFKINQFERPEIPYSDHYPIIADLNFSQHTE